jgi:protein SCO1/2
MAKLDELSDSLSRRGNTVPIVAVTVDPEHDTPDVLAAYRSQRSLSPKITLATGTSAEIRSLAARMMLPVGDRTGGADGAAYDIAHAGKLVLVDQRGDVRALTDTDPRSLGGIANAARLLLDKGPDA